MSMNFDTSVAKQPIRRLEIPINKFNDVAVPHHLDLLKRHKNNIAKFQENREWNRVYQEQANASRQVKQLKQLLYEMDVLRGQVEDSDILKFDELTGSSRENIMKAIQEYLELQLDIPLSRPTSPEDKDQTAKDPLHDSYVQLHAEEEELEQQQACLHAWNSLQDDMYQLQQLFIDFNQVVHEQKEHVNRIEDNIEVAETNVVQGNSFLEKAAKYKTATYPLAGALIGTCLGGPVGLVAGLKFGGLAAIGCGLLGFTGGKILNKKQISGNTEPKLEMLTDGQRNVKGSISLPDNMKDANKQL